MLGEGRGAEVTLRSAAAWSLILPSLACRDHMAERGTGGSVVWPLSHRRCLPAT